MARNTQWGFRALHLSRDSHVGVQSQSRIWLRSNEQSDALLAGASRQPRRAKITFPPIGRSAKAIFASKQPSIRLLVFVLELVSRQSGAQDIDVSRRRCWRRTTDWRGVRLGARDGAVPLTILKCRCVVVRFRPAKLDRTREIVVAGSPDRSASRRLVCLGYELIVACGDELDSARSSEAIVERRQRRTRGGSGGAGRGPIRSGVSPAPSGAGK